MSWLRAVRPTRPSTRAPRVARTHERAPATGFPDMPRTQPVGGTEQHNLPALAAVSAAAVRRGTSAPISHYCNVAGKP
jgi:hypothetical protein